MSDKSGLKTKAPHPQVVEDIGLAAPYALLKLADDFELGVIPAEKYNQANINHSYPKCADGHCIWSWLLYREPQMSKLVWTRGMANLFGAGHPSNPQLAARAIRRYVYENAFDGWKG